MCGKMNHWKGSEFCEMKGKVRWGNQDCDSSNSDSDVTSIKALNAFVNGVASRKDKPIYCEMHMKSSPVRLQVDCVATVSTVVESEHDISQDFADVFNRDLGTLPGSVCLTMKPDAEPILRSPKRLLVELRDQVKQELDRLVNVGVLAPIDEPTCWVNRMAIATKKSLDLHRSTIP